MHAHDWKREGKLAKNKTSQKDQQKLLNTTMDGLEEEGRLKVGIRERKICS